jgi:hypothetical protein
MESGVVAFRQICGAPNLPFAEAILALAYARLGRIDEAIAALDGALARVGDSGEKCYLAEVLWLKGEVLLKIACRCCNNCGQLQPTSTENETNAYSATGAGVKLGTA